MAFVDWQAAAAIRRRRSACPRFPQYRREKRQARMLPPTTSHTRKLIVALALLLPLAGALAASEASAQSSPCKTIADDKERLACYDKAANANQNAVEQNTAPVEKTPDARDA